MIVLTHGVHGSFTPTTLTLHLNRDECQSRQNIAFRAGNGIQFPTSPFHNVNKLANCSLLRIQNIHHLNEVEKGCD
jgi:hypothetical protein